MQGDEIGLAEWIAALGDELERAQRLRAARDIKFEVGASELEIEVTTSRDLEGKGEVKFWVLGSGSASRKTTEGSRARITLSLTPEGPTGRVKVGRRGDQEPS
ncbi:trypco2 family protein [Streptomyces sp. NBC_01304]|uniref:trypco2 family protein n=1 Tax=Streptomyces sp. NBC_01304 TaxID=2903818 RepID=UPI002E1367EC|nr:hypothetical protein OG430_01250 [Streptomyces sp. NBC_01304]